MLAVKAAAAAAQTGVLVASRTACTDSACTASGWAHVKQAPPDAILGVAAAYNMEKRKDKVNLSVGAYRDENGKPVVLKCVRKAEASLLKKHPGHEYLPIGGLESFNAGARVMAFGKDGDHCDHRTVATVQALSGTGALRLAGAFLKRWHPLLAAGASGVSVYLPSPTWGNHRGVFKEAGLAVKDYRYFDHRTGGVDVDGMVADMKAAPEGSVFLLHACAHNPTGADPSADDWVRVRDACIERRHVVVFDSAYQGFASGDPERDAFAVRMFVRAHRELGGLVLCQSFAKNLGLYGERVGALHVVCGTADEARRVRSQLEAIIRPMYSSPPAWGARLASTVFGSAELTHDWADDMKGMAGRIGTMRHALVDALGRAGSTRNWDHITKQIGMFSFTGLTKPQCAAMIRDHAVYLTANGRISMAGLNHSNVDKVAAAIHHVTTHY